MMNLLAAYLDGASPTLPFIATSLLALLATTLLMHRVIRRTRTSDVPFLPLPPRSGGLPFIGETLEMISAYKTDNPEQFADERIRKHGRLFTTHLFGETTVYSTDPEVNSRVVKGEGRLFESSYPSSLYTLLGRHSLVVSKGSLHKRLHSLALGSFANATVLRDHLLPDIDRLVRANLHTWEDGQVLRLLDHTKKITFELAVKQLMSCEPGEWTEELRRHYHAVVDGFFSLPIPYLPFTTFSKALKARKKVSEALRPVVKRRKEEMVAKRGEEMKGSDKASRNERMVGGGGKDMLEKLLEEGEVMGEEEMVDFLLSLLVAGYETTPTIMTFIVKFLSECPRAHAILKEEHESIRRRKSSLDPLDWSDYKTFMPFTQCVINETLRMANIVSGVFRRAIDDVHVKGYKIPKGCKVFASFRAVHLDPNYYEDARTFNPWRWQQAADLPNPSQQEASIFTPFGGGPRLCPGYELARLEISVFLHYLVTNFSWEATEEDVVIHFPTSRTIKGYPIRVRKVMNSSMDSPSNFYLRGTPCLIK